MDVVRKHSKRNRVIKRSGLLFVIALAGLSVTGALARLEPAAPTVSRDAVVIDSVERGTMSREVRAPGTLIPVDITWIPARTDGRIVSLPLKPGTAVEAETVILQLANRKVENDAEDAKWAHVSAQAELLAAKEQLANQHLELEGAAAEVEAALTEAKLQREVDEQLYKEKLISGQKHQLSLGRVQQLQKKLDVAKEKARIFKSSIDPQLQVYRAKVNQALALHRLKQKDVDDLTVRAGKRGILQQLGDSPASSTASRANALAIGQLVTAGTPLAMITDPKNLQAELNVPEVQARDLLMGQSVVVDARVAKMPGKVVRIDPASYQGTVAVDVKLEGELPQGARPDLSVNGTILIERLDDILFTGRILYAQPGQNVSVFKLEQNGGYANRITIGLGRSSVHTIEILRGLEEGDEVIISGTKRWESYDRIRLQ